jgi:GNAT superfamily N-acetyltransferase
MEEVILAVRRLWFGAKITRLSGAVSVQEAGGEILMAIDRDGPSADELIAAAAQRNAYIVATDFSNPPDLAVRLRCKGFLPVQSHGTYVLDEAAYDRAAAAEAPRADAGRHGLLSLLWRRERPAVTVRQIGMEELPDWNAVCWRAFASRVTEAGSLVDKQTAYFGMGAAARWYLATVNGRPAGTAILFQGEGAAQILAVGTLPSLQGRGVATAVLRQMVSDWRRDGKGFLFLDTEPGSNAERLYMHLGFVPAYVREIYAPGLPLS